MIKTFIDKIRDVENCIELDVLAGDEIYSLHIDECEDKKERLEELFNQINTTDEIEITISLFEDDKERVCTIIIFPEEEMFALLHKDLTEKMLKQAYKDAEEDFEEIPDDFENMFGKFSKYVPAIRIDDDEGCDAANLIIDRLSNVNKEMTFCTIGGTGYYFSADADKETKLDALFDFFFTERVLEEGIDFYIEVCEDDKKRLCTLTVTRDSMTIHGSPMAKKIILGEYLTEKDISENISIEDFESIFGKVDKPFVNRIYDLNFDFNN